MSKSFQTTRVLSLVFGATALIALASPIAPAAAQGTPAGLLRLDSSQPNQYDPAQSLAQQDTVRSTYAHVRKHKAQQAQ